VIDIEAVLIDLQSRIAYQDDTIQQLNDVIVSQDRTILNIEHQLKDLSKQMLEMREEMRNQGGISISDERPPHY